MVALVGGEVEGDAEGACCVTANEGGEELEVVVLLAYTYLVLDDFGRDGALPLLGEG